MAARAPSSSSRPPGRALLRIAGLSTQLACGMGLLVGTIALVLVLQNQAGGVVPVLAWLVVAIAGLVFGGLVYRGGRGRVLGAAGIDAVLGTLVLTLVDDATLRPLLKLLPASDVQTIGDVLQIAGGVMIVAGLACLAALPQGIRLARWYRDGEAAAEPRVTAPGFPPPPVPVRGSTAVVAVERPGVQRWVYLALGGLSVGVGVAVGLVVSWRSGPAPVRTPARTAVAATPPATPVAASRAGSTGRNALEPARDAGVPLDAAGPLAVPSGTAQGLVSAQHAAIANADLPALGALLASGAFGFGVDADEVAEGRDAVVAQLARDLGEPPPGGFTVESRALAIGEDRGHAWIAEELELAAADRAPRRLVVTELAAVIDGAWKVVALHWAEPVADDTAERLAILRTLPRPQAIRDQLEGPGELDRAVRAAFASRSAFADALTERADAFNFGSGGERAQGGPMIKRIFARLKAQLRLRDGVRVVAGGAWDPAQRTAPWIAWAAINVDFTSRTRAATLVTQPFRVLAVLLKDGADWKIVQSQWSNGGPIR